MIRRATALKRSVTSSPDGWFGHAFTKHPHYPKNSCMGGEVIGGDGLP
jgi:hypothetical protein